MTPTIGYEGYRQRLQEQHISPLHVSQDKPPCTVRLSLLPHDWGKAAQYASTLGLRWAGLWVDQHGPDFYQVHALLMAADGPIWLHTQAPCDQPLASHTPYYVAADRMERHARDLWGLRFTDHPRPQRWTRHQAWDEDETPLSPDFQAKRTGRTPADSHYAFTPIQGSGVFEIPVGPVHAGIIEPGHFRFHVAGEAMLKVETRLGYVHRGIEKAAVGRDPAALLRLAARVSGDSTVAHSWAACQAIEQATGTVPSARALLLRGLLCERERLANHIGDIGAICNDVGFAFAHLQCQSLRERCLRQHADWFGHRLLMDTLVPGGVCCDLDPATQTRMQQEHKRLYDSCQSLFDLLNDQPSLEDRLLGTGYLSAESARTLGVTGYVGKASGQKHDLRAQLPYAPYDGLTVPVVCLDDGDVSARWQVRQREVLDSLKLMNHMLHTLQDTPTTEPLQTPLQHSQGGEGMGLVEGWRGETLCYVRLDENNRVLRYFPRDPSWFYWPALERVVVNNIVPDFPVCNKSINGSYAGHDL